MRFETLCEAELTLDGGEFAFRLGQELGLVSQAGLLGLEETKPNPGDSGQRHQYGQREFFAFFFRRSTHIQAPFLGKHIRW